MKGELAQRLRLKVMVVATFFHKVALDHLYDRTGRLVSHLQILYIRCRAL